ncbi:MAG: glycosyltransferase [Candidatus Kuenenbacteria bacterium]
MRLIFITRKVDKNDPRAGFVYYWLEKLAKKLDKLIVICQEKGDTAGLPKNIEIFSFGKDKGYGKLRQCVAFKLLLLKHIRKTNGVFAHMMPIYSIVAGPFCKIFNKKLVQWYMHRSVDWRLKFANLFVSEFATASKMSFRLKTKKKINILGHGIDISRFAPISQPKADQPLAGNFHPAAAGPNSKFQILTVGRISPSKDIESMIKAVYELKEEGMDNIKLTIVGGIGLAKQQIYLDNLKNMVSKMNIENQVEFIGSVPHAKIPEFYQNSDLFLNLSDTGSLDKAVLAAMSAECLPITSNEAFENILQAYLMTAKDKPQELAKKIKWAINLSQEQRTEIVKPLRQEIANNHNLDKLVDKIIRLYES